jgi:hypothetical protein
MIVDNKSIYLNIYTNGSLNHPDPTNKTNEATTIIPNNYLDILLSSLSNLPTLDLPSLIFYLIQVSGPIKITTAKASAEHKTHVCHRVYYKSKFYYPPSLVYIPLKS